MGTLPYKTNGSFNSGNPYRRKGLYELLHFEAAHFLIKEINVSKLDYGHRILKKWKLYWIEGLIKLKCDYLDK